MKEVVLKAVIMCELCGKSCKKSTTIRNIINGSKLKICNNCMEKYQFEQETEGTNNGL